MKPVKFEQSNRTLSPPGAQYSDNVDGIEPLQIWTDGEQCVSCWKMSPKERLSALFSGCVWIAVLSGETQPPISAMVEREYLK